MKRKYTVFTLIELIVVIATIAILTSMLFKAMDVGRKKVRKTGCMDNLRQMGAATAAFSGDNQGQLPAENVYTNGDDGLSSGNMSLGWKFQLASYVYPRSGIDYIGSAIVNNDTSNIAHCKPIKMHDDLITKSFECPEAPYFVSSSGEDYETFIIREKRGGYGLNSSLSDIKKDSVDKTIVRSANYLRSANVDIPSETLLIADTLTTAVEADTAHRLIAIKESEGDYYYVHDTGVDTLWVDGHVSWSDDKLLKNYDNNKGFNYFFKHKK